MCCTGVVNFIGATLWIEHSDFDSNYAGAIGGAIFYQNSHVPANAEPDWLVSIAPAMSLLATMSLCLVSSVGLVGT